MRYGVEWTPGLVAAGLVVILPLAPPFALIAVMLLALGALAALVALTAAMLAIPYLLVRNLRRRLALAHTLSLTSMPATTTKGFTHVNLTEHRP